MVTIQQNQDIGFSKPTIIPPLQKTISGSSSGNQKFFQSGDTFYGK